MSGLFTAKKARLLKNRSTCFSQKLYKLYIIFWVSLTEIPIMIEIVLSMLREQSRRPVSTRAIDH